MGIVINSAHLADNNILPGIRFYIIDVCVFFPTIIIVPCIKTACSVSSCYLNVCVFALFLYFIYK